MRIRDFVIICNLVALNRFLIKEIGQMKPINYNKQLLIAGSLFTVHNIEESIGFSYFSYPESLPIPIEIPASKPMILSIILITIIVWLIILWTFFRKRENTKRNVLTVLVAMFVFNAIFPHIVGALWLKQYFPAVVTSVVLYLPYSFWMLPKLRRFYFVKKHFYSTIIVGLIISFLVVFLLQLTVSNRFKSPIF